MPEPIYFWEDFEPGSVREAQRAPITKAEILDFAAEFDPQVFHLDEEAAAASLLGGLCASGWHTCALMMRLMCDTYILESASLGAPGVEEVRWLKPLFVGDTLTVRSTCLATRPSASRPEMGLAQFQWQGFNQHGQEIVTLRSWAMFRRRAPATSAGSAA
jgi:acyl dehydratase